MATSNKDFKIKNGLIVEGDSATVNGNDVLTSASSIDELNDVVISTPADNQVLAYDELTSSWKNVTIAEGSSVVVSATPPTDPAPTEGTQWFNSSTGTTYIYYDNFWVPVSPPKAGPQGPQGEQGDTGLVAQASEPSGTSTLWLDVDEDGVGIPLGGTAGQVLAKVDSGSFNTEWVDVYTPAQTDSAISAAVSSLVDSAPIVLDTLNELSAALNDDPNFSTTITNALAALVPAGTINQTARSTAPTGYLLCDGSAISRTTFATLFTAIGTAYGVGDGSSTFNIPNLRGRIPVGFDSTQTEFDTLGEIGGAKTHTLTEAQIPSHTHIQNSHNHTQNSHNHTQNAHSHSPGGAGSNSFLVNGAGTNGGANITTGGGGYAQSSEQATTATNQATTATNQATTATNQNTGGGESHNNLQPYVVLNYMIKV